METSSKSQQTDVNSNEIDKVNWKERLKLCLKFALVIAVFYYLHYKGLITSETFVKLFSSPSAVIICSCLILTNTMLGAFRWQILLRTQGADLSFLKILRLNLIGAFFNIALPGAVSGDFVKAVQVAKIFKDKRAAVFGSMLFDRILGVSAMGIVAALAALISLFIPWGGHLPNHLLYSVFAIGLGVTFFFAYLFISHKKDPVFRLLSFFTRRHERLGSIDRLYHGVMSYRAFPNRVLKAIAFSVLIHMLVIVMAFVLTLAISTGANMSLIAVAVVVPIGILSTAVPILPAGVGTGHFAFQYLYEQIGSKHGAEVFSLIVIYQVIVGVIGGIVYLKSLSDSHKSH